MDSFSTLQIAQELVARLSASAGGSSEPEVMTPAQKLQKKLDAENEKLQALITKKVTARTNVQKDAEAKAKHEEKILELEKELAALHDKAVKPVAVKAEKNLPTMKAALKSSLKAAFAEAGAKWEDKQSVDQFMTYVNAFTPAEFAECENGLQGHMTNFAKIFSPEEDSTPAQGGGGAEAAPALRVLTVPELVKHFKAKNLKQVKPGVFTLTKTGETVTGPHEVDDSDYEEREMDGKTYMVCPKTLRVYEPTDDADKFVGFWGVGEW